MTHVRLNLNNLNVSSSLPTRFEFRNCQNIKNANIEFETILIEPSISGDFYINETWYTRADVKQISEDETYIEFDCNMDMEEDGINLLMSQNVLQFDTSGYTTLFCYRLNSERDYLKKDLTLIDIISGTFKAPLGIKNIEIDVANYDISYSYNYIYIRSLNRYYYVSNILFVTKDYTRLQLQEDVLMSWKTLIKRQRAFISRYEGSTESELIDTKRPLKDMLKVEDITGRITSTPVGQTLVNFSFNYRNDYTNYDYPNIMVLSLSTKFVNARTSYLSAPSGSGLPDLTTQLNTGECVAFIRPSKLYYLNKAYMSSDSIASYYICAMWLPFDPSVVFNIASSNLNAIHVRDKFIDDTGVYQDEDSTGHTPLETFMTPAGSGKSGLCPYLILKDFTYYYDGDFIDREPNANYEFFIPFVGWVNVPSYKFFNKRVLIYYTMDLKTGLSTAYIYNYTDKIVIWSGTCQIGIKIDLATTNIEENIRQKQANNLNMAVGLLSSLASIGIGIASENPLAIVGGVLGGAKTITSFVNTNNQIFDRAQMSFGTPNGALYSSKEFILVKAYHEPLNINLVSYKHLEGLPYNNYVYNMTTLTGYVEVGDIHFDPKGENIYNAEIDEIVGLLKGGVIF